MKATWTLLKLEAKSVFAGAAVPLGFLGLFLAGVYGLYYGNTAIERQRAVLEESDRLYREHQAYVHALAPEGALAGDLLYTTFLHTHHEPSRWAAFSLGGRDVQPFNLKVRLLTLEGQLYDSELTNPTALFYGNFDASFVIVALFPLLVIALTFGVISGEQESGTWNLIRAQGASLGRVITIKLGVRIVSVLLLALAVVALAGVYFGASAGVVLETAAIVTAYLLLWFAACFLVATFGRSSSFNAIALLALWLSWTTVGPSLANVAIATAMPVPEALEVTVRQRQGYHESWDRPQREVLEGFYRSYPQYARYDVPDDRYSNGWYYAMNQMGDDAARDVAASYRRTLLDRQGVTDRLAPFLPPVTAQRALNRLARTDLESHFLYLDSVRAYHEELKEFFYPIVFREDSVEAVDWSSVPRHWHSDEGRAANPRLHLFTLSTVAVFLFTSGAIRLRARFGFA